MVQAEQSGCVLLFNGGEEVNLTYILQTNTLGFIHDVFCLVKMKIIV